MKNIFSHQGYEALKPLSRGHALFAFDFDGTLAPLADHPAQVRLSRSVMRQLYLLASDIPVVIISGRGLKDLRKYFPRFPGILIGNHGAEGISEGRVALRKARQICQLWRPRLCRLVENYPHGGTWLEDKIFSFTVHSREPSSLRAIRRTLLLEARSPFPLLRLMPGKASINLLPASLPDKGWAVSVLLRKIRAEQGLFVGDDVTDEDVFSTRLKGLVTVRVGRLRKTRATFTLDSQSAIRRLLAELIKLRRGS